MPLTVLEIRSMTLQCDGPRCAKGENGGPKVVVWHVDAETAENGEVPDDVYRFIPLGPMVGQQRAVTFCSPACLRDHMRSYVPPQSPREIEEQRKRNAEVEAKKNERPEPEEGV